jgi:predicted ribosome quality control (RQC) complex YloA/Tae2 family protein
MPGSHVIVDFTGEPPEATLREAAMLAAYFSQAKTSSNVPVDYTLRKNVKKPSGARPGMVIYSTNRTLYVTPEPARVLSLRADS